MFNITSYKAPKRITGFEIRPILIKRPKIKRKVKKKVPKKKTRSKK
jgi:hypothetical protein